MYRIAIIVLLFATAVAARPARREIGTDPTPKHLRKGAVGIKFGFLNAGRVTVDDDTKYDLNAATCGGVFFDVPFSRQLQGTVAVDLYDIRFLNLSQRFLDASVGAKRVFFSPNTNIAFKPGASIGLGYLANVGPVRPSTFLTLKWFLEVMMFTQSKYAIVFDIGWFVAPVGDSEGKDISIAPSLYLRAGLSL